LTTQKEEQANSNLALWILCGAAIQVVLLIPTIIAIHDTLQSTPASLFPPAQLQAGFLLLYLIIPIIYAAYASCKQKPKHIISTMQTGFWATVVAGLMIEMILPTTPFLTYYTEQEWVISLLLFAVIWVLALLLAVGIGYLQTMVVRFLVGLDETSVHHVTYRINVDFAKVQEAVLKKDFLESWKFKKLDHEPELVLKSRMYPNQRVDDLLVISAWKNPTWFHGAQTLIHGTAFSEFLYDIRATQFATNRLDKIINDLVGTLNVTKDEPLDEHDELHEHLKSVANEFVSQRTRTKFAMIQTRFLYSRICNSTSNLLMKAERNKRSHLMGCQIIHQ
jgi:hypothetical protein